MDTSAFFCFLNVSKNSFKLSLFTISSELDDELLEDDDQDTVPLEEITDVASTDSEEN